MQDLAGRGPKQYQEPGHGKCPLRRRRCTRQAASWRRALAKAHRAPVWTPGLTEPRAWMPADIGYSVLPHSSYADRWSSWPTGEPAAVGSDSRRASMMSGKFVSIQSASASTLAPTVLPRGVNEYSTWGGTVS
jgi:hypothetical protein